MKIKHLLAASVVFCAAPLVASANVHYECSSNVPSEQITATLFDEEDLVVVYYVTAATGLVTNEITMRPAPSGSGFRYSGQGLDFIGQGDDAIFTDGTTSISCYVSFVDEPGGGNAGGGGFDPQVGPFPGFSFGGNLRGGPGTNFADVGSTFEGQPLTLVSDTGIFFNGYSWWAVQLQNGQQAYQWGGLLCSPGLQLAGVFNDGC